MAYSYGFVGTVTILSSGAFCLGQPIRVFDVCLGTTAAASSVVLWNLSAAGDTSGTFPVCTAKAGGMIASNAGLRFNNGLYCALSGGGTATMNYIEEL